FSYDNRFKKGMDWYSTLFEGAKDEKRIGEVSVNYFFDKRAPKRIKESLGNISNLKLIVLLREPIDRARSHYTLRMQKGEAPLSFEKALDDPKLPLRKEGHYITYYRRYLEHFNKDQIGIFLYKDIRNDPRFVLQDICTFLEVDPAFFNTYNNTKVNESYAVRFPCLSWTLGKLARVIRFFLPYGNIGERIRSIIQTLNRRWNRKRGKVPIKEETLKTLTNEYKDNNKLLAKEAEIDVTAWDYNN
ncbi:MAG: sulfotransferase domain-containing protein, partial [Candidatus Peregrinibacteria bacterium]|nr:sulfotransferase domain-containing protein [Candidatus Peregrinibacteria bacterium]